MPPFSSTSKALRSLIANAARSRHFVRPAKHDQIRCTRTVAGVSVPLSNTVIDYPRDFNSTLLVNSYSGSSAVQRRGFLGCGDGEEGGVLSKVYEERRVLGYSPEQLFDVVAAVDFYHGFVPWCQRSDILKRYPDGSFDAELEIGFKFLVESYVSHVELKRPKMLKTTASQSGLFDHLINIWEFNPGPVPGSCDLYFLVDFKFQSPLYRQVASMFFKEVVSRLVGSFSERCRLIYGPGVRVLENSYGRKNFDEEAGRETLAEEGNWMVTFQSIHLLEANDRGYKSETCYDFHEMDESKKLD